MTLSHLKLLDETGRQILLELQADARVPLSELGRRVGLSAPAAGERVRRLEEAGVILGYRVQLDPTKLGLPLQAYVRLRTENGKDVAFAQHAPRLPELLSCDRVTGEDCFVLKVAVTDVDHLERLIITLKAYGSPVTSLVLSSPVPVRTIEPPR